MTLPTGLLPEPTPAKAGPAPGAGTACDSVPATCAHCRDHHPRLQGQDGTWRHYRVFKGNPKGQYLSDCANPPKPPEAKHQEARRSAEECMKRLHELATKGSAVSALVEARETFATHSQVEDDDDQP